MSKYLTTMDPQKSGSYSPRRAFQQSLHQGGPSAEEGFTLRYHPGTPNTTAICPHGHTPKTPATPHSHHHQQQHARAKSWDNLTTPKNLRKCLFPSSPSPFLLRKKTSLQSSKEAPRPSADVPCSAKGSKSCTALCSRCSQRPLDDLRTVNDNIIIASDKDSQTIACDKASQTVANDFSQYPTITSNSQSCGSRSSVSESLHLHSSTDSMHCREATVPSVPASPSVSNTPMVTSSSAMVPVPPAACQGSESGRPSLWRTNDPSLSSLCKRAEELIDISRSRTLQGRVPIAPCNYNVSDRPSHYITTTIDSSNAGLGVTQNAHDQGYSMASGSNSCTSNITSNTRVPILSSGKEVSKDSASCCLEASIRMSGSQNVLASCPSFPRTSTVNPCNEDAGYVKHSNVSLEGTPLAHRTTLCPILAGKSVINEDGNPISHHLQESLPMSVPGGNSICTTPGAALKHGVHPGLVCGVVPASVHDLAQSPGSPLTNAVLHDSISQALVLTPRSRCPIVATRNGGRGATATSSSTVAALARHNLSSAQRHSITGASANPSCCLTEFGREEQGHHWQSQATSGAISRENPNEAVTIGSTIVGLEARWGNRGAAVTGDGLAEVRTFTADGCERLRIAGGGDGSLSDSRNIVASKCPSSGSTENVPPAVEIHYSPSQQSEAHLAGYCRHSTVNTEKIADKGSKTCTLVRRKSTLSRKNASDSDILEISRKSSFRKEDPKKSSSSKNVSSLGKAVRRSLSRRLSKSWRRSNKAGGLLARQGGSSMLDSDQDTVDSGFDTSNALFGSDDTSSRGDFPSDFSSQDIDLEGSAVFYSSQRAHYRSATGSESELVLDLNRLMEDQTVLSRSNVVRPDVCSPVGNEPMAMGYLTKSPLSPFSNTPPSGVRDSRYSSSTSEALGSFFKHLSSSSLAEIAKRLKTYNDPALLNSSYRMLSPIESDTSSCSLPSTPVKELDESLSLVFREYLESRAIVMGQEGSEEGGSSIAGCEEKCRSDPLFESCSVVSFTSGGHSCASAISEGGRSVSCGAINSLALSLPTNFRDKPADENPLETILSPTGGDASKGVVVNGSVLEKTGQEEQISDSFHSVGGEFSESLMQCLDGLNPLSVSCDAATKLWEATDDLIKEQENVSPRKAVHGGVPTINRAVSYKSAVDLGELLSINLMGVTINVADNCASDHNLRENCGQEANKENSVPENLCDDFAGNGKNNLTPNSTFDAAFMLSRQVGNAKNRSPLRPRKSDAKVMSTLEDQNISSEIRLQKNYSSSQNLDLLKFNRPKLQDCRNSLNSSPDTPPGIVLNEHLVNSTACYPRQPPLTNAKGSEDPSCCSQGTRCQKLLGTKHGTPMKSLQSGACAQPTKVHFETSL